MREHNELTMDEDTWGTRFGNYELIRRIDVGGMGEVYLASQLTAFKRTVAIKIIRADLAHDMTAHARFVREAEVSAHLKHEHILQLIEFGEEDGRVFLVTPYVEGGTLAQRLKTSGSLSREETHELFVPLVEAVAYIHRRGVVHRDIKLSNIMLDTTEDGKVYVRLIDFGIATLQGHSASPPLTMAGNEPGTVAYMAPERLSGVAAPSNDIYSLGVILHKMLTGRVPTVPPKSEDELQLLPDPLARVVRRATENNPSDRYATAEDLLKGYELAYEEVTRAEQASTPSFGQASYSPVASSEEPEIDLSDVPTRIDIGKLMQPAELTVVSAPAPFQGRQATIASIPAQNVTRPPTRRSFTTEDYEAPTTFLNRPETPSRMLSNSRQPLFGPSPVKKPGSSAPRPKRSKLVLIVSLLMVIVSIAAGLILYQLFQIATAASVSINFAPRTQVISLVTTLKADPRVASIDPVDPIIPEPDLKTPQLTSSKSARTTGSVNCQLGVFDCQPGVSVGDVSALVAQLQPDLDQRINQALANEIRTQKGTQIGSIYITRSTSSTPAVGQPGTSVTVTLVEQGSVLYYSREKATAVALRALNSANAHFGANYHLVDSTVNIGSFVVQSTDSVTGVSTIAVAEGAVSRYQFTDSEFQFIRKGLVGKTQAEALAFLHQQTGIDPASIQISFTSGNGKTMPADTDHIHLLPLAPDSLPNVQLTPIATTSSGSGTPAATPAPTSTP